MTYQPYRVTIKFNDGHQQIYVDRNSTFRIMMQGVEGMVRAFGYTSADVESVNVECVA